MFMNKRRKAPSASRKRRSRRQKLDDDALFSDDDQDFDSAEKATFDGEATGRPKKRSKKAKPSSLDDDLFMSASEDDLPTGGGALEDDSSDLDSDDLKETDQERRLRIAKEMITSLGGNAATPDSDLDDDSASDDEDGASGKQTSSRKKAFLSSVEENEESDMDDVEHNRIDSALRTDTLRKRGKLKRALADHVKEHARAGSDPQTSTLRGHKLAVTCIALSPDNRSLYTGSKDGSIIEYDVAPPESSAPPSYRKRHRFHSARNRENVEGHTDQVWALAVSGDGRFLASGGRDCLVFLWDTKARTLLHKFRGHRKPISALLFQHGTSTLFSASFDRSLKYFDCDTRTYIDTLFGHEHHVTAMTTLLQDRILTCGADKTARLYKIEAESQLVFRASPKHQRESLDCCVLINTERFACGSQDGSLSLWAANRKKPLSVVRKAHGGKWICSLAAVPFSDLVASGSLDGFVRIWKMDYNRLHQVCALPVTGFVNSLRFDSPSPIASASDSDKTSKGQDADAGTERRFRLFAGVGQEHRFGRWECVRAAKNSVQVFDLGPMKADQ